MGMIHEIIQIDGAVNYPVTLDPSVWIFDKRKFPIQDLFPQIEEQGDCMYVNTFLPNAEPLPEATHVICHLGGGKMVTLPIEQVSSGIFRFSKNKKALREDGPAWLYFADGSNCNNPVISIKRLELV